MKKYRSIIAILCIISVFTSTVFAESISNLEKKQQDINKNIEKKENDIKDKQATMDEIQAEIAILDKELTAAANELKAINKQLEEVNLELELANERLNQAEIEKNNQMDTLEKRVRYMYEYGETTYLDVLLSSKDFSDLLNRVEYIKIINDYDKNIYDDIVKKQAEIAELIVTIDKKKVETEVLQKSAASKKDELQSNVTQKQALTSRIESDINLLEKQIAEEERANKNVESMIQAELKRQEELLRAQNVPMPEYNGSAFMWPTPSNHTVNSPFGYRIHPITGKNTLHAGVDIPVGMGTKVYASQSGTVMTAGSVSGYGTTVIINHGSGLSTLYGHLSSTNVSVGQSVSQGDLIAYSGNTGNSTGPHLHFEVRKDGVVQDPLSYTR